MYPPPLYPCITPQVVAAFAERREFDKILIYSKHVCRVVKPEVRIPAVYICFCMQGFLNWILLKTIAYISVILLYAGEL
jgi:hypothetical protein